MKQRAAVEFEDVPAEIEDEDSDEKVHHRASCVLCKTILFVLLVLILLLSASAGLTVYTEKLTMRELSIYIRMTTGYQSLPPAAYANMSTPEWVLKPPAPSTSDMATTYFVLLTILSTLNLLVLILFGLYQASIKVRPRAKSERPCCRNWCIWQTGAQAAPSDEFTLLGDDQNTVPLQQVPLASLPTDQ